MKRYAWWFVILLIGLAHPAGGQTLGTNFTYQGQLKHSGVPLNATADFEFKLFNAPSGGAQVGSANPVSNVNVVDGLFTVSLNFGSGALNGDQRWLEIAARSPAGGGNFTTLTPRQPLTATPYALQTRGIYADAAGNIGIGTTAPVHPLHVAAPIPVLALQDSDGTTTQSGYISLRNSANVETGYVGFGDQTVPHLALWNFRPGGNLQFMTLNVERMTVTSAGNVGIGTTTPAAKLDVRGDIRLGNSGQFLAPAAEENLRIIRGTITANGNILAGAGFTVDHSSIGRYIIFFNTPFAATPTVTATYRDEGQPRTATIFINGSASTFVDIVVDSNDSDHEDFNLTDRAFQFIAIGPR